MTTTLSSLEVLPHQIMTTVLEYLPLGNLYFLERTSKSLRAAVEFNSYLKYQTYNGNRRINPLQLCGAYAVHHAWNYITYWMCDRMCDWMCDRMCDRMCDTLLIRYREYDDFANSLTNCNLLDKPAIYPFISHLKLEVLHHPEVGEIEVSSGDGGPLTFRDVLGGIHRCLKDVNTPGDHFSLYFRWKEGSTFLVGLNVFILGRYR
jgi:hypothetical protein